MLHFTSSTKKKKTPPEVLIGCALVIYYNYTHMHHNYNNFHFTKKKPYKEHAQNTHRITTGR